MKHHYLRIMTIFFTTMISGLAPPSGFACESSSSCAGLENATYRGIEDEPVTLMEGRWEGQPYVEGGASRPVVGLVKDIRLTGDLDGDGNEETVVLLWQSGGGTGSNIHLAVMRPENGGYRNISTALLGDRVKLRGGRIDAGRILLDVLQTGENDAMCCPTQLATRTWTLEGTQLQEDEMKVTGKLSLMTLEGSEWLLTRLDQVQIVPEDARVTLFFEAGRISGTSACNRYSAGIEDGDSPGDVRIGPAMGTRMACPDPLMEVERNYLESLAKVKSFSFQTGRLELNARKDDGSIFSMSFVPLGADTP